MEQYPPELPNRRMLYIDRMLRELSHKSRSQLVLAFREQKLEALKLQAVIAAKQQEEEEEELRAAEEKERKRRDQEHKQV
ncbi:hypothetical protein OS493_016051 [Desmophyllum pertusum]|uniref:Uncharacterized protein n=1 Tax=Desmophyllum pertusum TaxID=174260 RepID=A0A9X0A537_9CNID|nr:hypothetical protein OS493_016051 [Desmophyllum pertusum]